MTERATALKFKGKWVGIERLINSKVFFYKGLVKDVSKKDLIIEHKGLLQTYTLDSITKIRELKEDEQDR